MSASLRRHSPETRYGVITLDGQKALTTGRKVISEKMLRGYVDVFEKKPKSLNTPNSVEAALSKLGIYFSLESVQFESDTGYVHWEWRWVDTLNLVKKELYVIKFVGLDGVYSEQIVQAGGTPVVPTAGNVVVDGINYQFMGWDKTVTEATANTVYNAVYRIMVMIRKTGGTYYARNYGSVPFSGSQVTTIVEWFDHGNAVACTYDGTITDASDVTMLYIWFSNITAYWA